MRRHGWPCSACCWKEYCWATASSPALRFIGARAGKSNKQHPEVSVSYFLLKHIHVSCAAIRIVPHYIDTALLASALALAYTIGQYPFVDAWLTAKFFGLVLFILLGTIALKHGKSKSIRIAAWFGALAVFVYIVLVAARHNPL